MSPQNKVIFIRNRKHPTKIIIFDKKFDLTQLKAEGMKNTPNQQHVPHFPKLVRSFTIDTLEPSTSMDTFASSSVWYNDPLAT